MDGDTGGGGNGADRGNRDRHGYRVRGNHRDLLLHHGGDTAPAPGAGLAPGRSMLAVPSARPVGHLVEAFDLAESLDWPLLVICSHDAKATQVRRLAESTHPGLQLTVVDLVAGSLRGRRPWRTPVHPAARQRSAIDTHRKRNLALAAARCRGLERVLLLDDDVRGLTRQDVLRGVAALGSSAAASTEHRPARPTMFGWPADVFPDNSVVCHGRREFTGLPQSTFVGAGALLVDVARCEADFFPPVYNEDWLFLFHALSGRQVAAGRGVEQLPYDPYDDPLRVRWQEFGDVLGEGLFHLLHVGAGADEATDPEFWRPVRGQRRILLDQITEQLRLRVDGQHRDQLRLHNALHAMAEARSQLTRATAESLADFVVRWLDDRLTWRELWDALPERETLAHALAYLGVAPWSVVTRSS